MFIMDPRRLRKVKHKKIITLSVNTYQVVEIEPKRPINRPTVP